MGIAGEVEELASPQSHIPLSSGLETLTIDRTTAGGARISILADTLRTVLMAMKPFTLARLFAEVGLHSYVLLVD